jgi:hypothetical protein
MPAVPYPTAPGIQMIIDHLAKTRPEPKALKPHDFIDPWSLKGLKTRLRKKAIRQFAQRRASKPRQSDS